MSEPVSRYRMQAQIDHLGQEIALLQEKLRIKDERMIMDSLGTKGPLQTHGTCGDSGASGYARLVGPAGGAPLSSRTPRLPAGSSALMRDA
jgi:hypothetical protein